MLSLLQVRNLFDLVLHLPADALVVYAPALVVGAGVGPVAPPAVGCCFPFGQSSLSVVAVECGEASTRIGGFVLCMCRCSVAFSMRWRRVVVGGASEWTSRS